ncbi:MAG: hypothetical protein AB7P14_17455 [Blastocatellales bacterium]
MRIEVLGKDCFRNSTLISELLQLLAPSFEEPDLVLQRAMEKSSRLYLGKDATGRIISFFFCDFGSHLSVAGSPLPSLYLGLSGTLQELKATGTVLPLYSLCIADAADLEACIGKKLWIWGATANTAVLRVVYKYMTSINPGPDGKFSSESRILAQALREYLKVPSSSSDHPFLLRRAFSGYRHTETEARRMQQTNRDDEFALVRQLDIRNCEAVLFVGQIGRTLPPFHTRTQVKVVQPKDSLSASCY